jgi:hypothetical protein
MVMVEGEGSVDEVGRSAQVAQSYVGTVVIVGEAEQQQVGMRRSGAESQ